MMKKLIAQGIKIAFASAAVSALYLALYWSNPLIPQSDADSRLEALCAKTNGCRKATAIAMVDERTHKPTLVAFVYMKPHSRQNVVEAPLKEMMAEMAAEQPFLSRWIAGNDGFRTEVIYEQEVKYR